MWNTGLALKCCEQKTEKTGEDPKPIECESTVKKCANITSPRPGIKS